MPLSAVRQAFQNPDNFSSHGTIVYQRNGEKVLPVGEPPLLKSEKKISAAAILSTIQKNMRNLSLEDAILFRDIAAYIARQKNQKIDQNSTHPQAIKRIFSRLQNFFWGYGFRTSNEINEKIHKYMVNQIKNLEERKKTYENPLLRSIHLAR